LSCTVTHPRSGTPCGRPHIPQLPPGLFLAVGNKLTTHTACCCGHALALFSHAWVLPHQPPASPFELTELFEPPMMVARSPRTHACPPHLKQPRARETAVSEVGVWNKGGHLGCAKAEQQAPGSQQRRPCVRDSEEAITATVCRGGWAARSEQQPSGSSRHLRTWPQWRIRRRFITCPTDVIHDHCMLSGRAGAPPLQLHLAGPTQPLCLRAREDRQGKV